MPRHKEPQFVTAWYRGADMEIPRCCHTCEHYKADGVCIQYAMQPPQEFAETLNQCDEWVQEIPF